jgi:phospholipid-binding lipoprotein MlaA
MRKRPDPPALGTLLAVLLGLATSLASTQRALAGDQSPASATPPSTTTTATSAPVQTTETPEQAAEDSQLPAYLRDNPEAEATSAAYDPWERYNRRMFRFNKWVDDGLTKSVALAYVRVVPQPVRTGVTHFYQNLDQPVTTVNLLLQGHPQSACKSLARFAVNTTIGIGGLFDPASTMHIPRFDEDFGQTLGHWGWRRSRYFLLPFAGPGTLRDRIGSLVDAEYGPYNYIHPTYVRIGVAGMSRIEWRVHLLPLEGLDVGIEDDYLLVREAWSQRRMHQIDDQNVDSKGADR